MGTQMRRKYWARAWYAQQIMVRSGTMNSLVDTRRQSMIPLRRIPRVEGFSKQKGVEGVGVGFAKKSYFG